MFSADTACADEPRRDAVRARTVRDRARELVLRDAGVRGGVRAARQSGAAWALAPRRLRARRALQPRRRYPPLLRALCDCTRLMALILNYSGVGLATLLSLQKFGTVTHKVLWK